MTRKRGQTIELAGMHKALRNLPYEHGIGEITLLAVGRRLAHVRGCAGVNQTSMARHLGVSLKCWQNYEQGKRMPQAEALVMMLHALDINPTWILTGTGTVLLGDGIPTVLATDDSPEDSSLTQAQNGRGSAGECPASSSAKTPAAGARCYRVAGVATRHGDGMLSLCVSLHDLAGVSDA